jgi:hypothetical protein
MFDHSLKRWMGALIAPSEQAPLKTILFKQSFIEESMESPHPLPIKAIIICIFNPIDHIKVTSNQPRPNPNVPMLIQLI